MIEVLSLNIRKKSKSNAAAFILAMSIVFAVALIVNLGMGRKSPMWSLNWLFVVCMIGFLIWWIIVNNKLKLVMKMWMDKEKRFYISVPLKDGTEIKLDNISAIEPIFGRVYYGRGPKVKDTYLKLYDEKGQNLLTLFAAYGALQEKPDEFFELEEIKILTYDKGPAVYTTSQVQEIYYTLKDSPHITIKAPVV